MMINYKAYLDIAINAARKSGAILIEQSPSEIKVNSEVDKDIKLQSDLDSEKVLLEEISQNSDFPILSEEFGFYGKEHSDGYLWVIDPLDGSLNFSRGIPLYCISIGLWKNSEPILGVIYNFKNSDLFTGIVGYGAFLNGLPIKSSSIDKLEKSIICTGFPVYSQLNDTSVLQFLSYVQKFKKVRLLGSAALSLTLLAKGSAEAYTEERIGFWDVAAGIAIVRAAGGFASYSFCSDNKNLLNVLVTNNLISI